MNVLVFLSAETKAEVDFCFGLGNKCNNQNYKGKTKSTRFINSYLKYLQATGTRMNKR